VLGTANVDRTTKPSTCVSFAFHHPHFPFVQLGSSTSTRGMANPSSSSTLPRPRLSSFGWKGYILLLFLVSYVQITFFIFMSRLSTNCITQREQAMDFPLWNTHHQQQTSTRRKQKTIKPLFEPSNPPTNITLVGISYSDNTLSDAAIQFLLEAACSHHIKSYILLGERDKKQSLNKMVTALSHHWYLPLPSADLSTVPHPECTKLIHIDQSPRQTELLNMTLTSIANNVGEELAVLLKTSSNSVIPNNPLDPENRIARIKRAREYQRQALGVSLGSYNSLDESVIALVDLDMFSYPSLQEVITTAQQYIPSGRNYATNNDAKYHAVCANGLQVSRSKVSRPKRAYYDTFSTILLPNAWLHQEADRVIPRGELEGENATMAKMNQRQILDWILAEGRRRDGQIDEQQSFDPVLVRSCFNGLTLYRADFWFHPSCRYDMYYESDANYRSKGEQQTCEHIVFHECLRREVHKNDGFRIAVQPDLLTLWHLIN